MKHEEVYRENVVWRSPSRGWIKANFGVVAKGNFGPTSSRGVLRDDMGRFIYEPTLPLRTQTNHYVEVATTYNGLNLAHS